MPESSRERPRDEGQALLSWLLSSGRGIKGFRREHAVYGMHAASRLAASIGSPVSAADTAGRSARRGLASQISVVYWCDDCMDQAMLAPAEIELIEAILAGEQNTAGPDWAGLLQWRRSWREWARSAEDDRLLGEHFRKTIQASRSEASFMRGELEWSYDRYLEQAADSIGVIVTMAALSSFWGLDMPGRMRSAPFREMMHHLACFSRLFNDLRSEEKERREASAANAIVVLERTMSREHARAFVRAESARYGRQIETALAGLEAGDPWRGVVGHLMASSHDYYDQLPRYG